MDLLIDIRGDSSHSWYVFLLSSSLTNTLNDDHNILFSGTSYVKVPRGLMNLTTHLNDTSLESFLHILSRGPG